MTFNTFYNMINSPTYAATKQRTTFTMLKTFGPQRYRRISLLSALFEWTEFTWDMKTYLQGMSISQYFT